MLAEAYKSRILLTVAAMIPLALAAFFVLRDGNLQTRQAASKLTANVGKDTSSIERMKESLAKDRQLLTGYERDQSVLRAEVIKRRKLLQAGEISQDRVIEAERSFVAALTRVHAMRESVVEAEIAITEIILGEKVLRMPVLSANGYSETTELVRFNGSFKWSLKESSRVERFFLQAFGRSLPIAAKGQSETHKRMGFDHRDAMDVALHPDSAEGKALITQLRKAGIPFVAFRSAVPGASTGPHIHIGKPSARFAH